MYNVWTVSQLDSDGCCSVRCDNKKQLLPALVTKCIHFIYLPECNYAQNAPSRKFSTSSESREEKQLTFKHLTPNIVPDVQPREIASIVCLIQIGVITMHPHSWFSVCTHRLTAQTLPVGEIRETPLQSSPFIYSFLVQQFCSYANGRMTSTSQVYAPTFRVW